MAQRPPDHPQRLPLAPVPASASATEGVATARQAARKYLPNAVALWAAVAFADTS
jgi:hypothetical protein